MLQQEFDRWRERHGGAEQALKDCDSGIVARSGALDALNAQRSAWERKAQDTRVALRCAVQRAGFTDEDDYRSALRAPEAVAELRDGVLEYVRAREAAGALSAQLENDLKGKARADLDALAQEERQAAMRQRERADERMNIHVRLEANGALIAELTGRAAAYEKLDARYQMVLRLSDTAGGKAVRDDAGRQSFELYVLSELFDEVILFANQRFSQMTGGQYELMREESYRNRRASFGLDLNVQDHFTGTVRPVNTLSGGESFMASLSLALGFADAISSHAGGIMLDSMFVDEGFGTLDEAALDQVMGALGRLAQGDVLIGLISHVPEMKRRIDRQIIVTKDRQGGSRAAVVV
jgi:exonuclease SbcC